MVKEARFLSSLKYATVKDEKLPLMKDEKDAIRKLLTPILKDQYFIKTSVRVDRLHQKLKTEGALSSEEISIKHPFSPDIDILMWPRQYSGEPYIIAVEVKYFRTEKGKVYPPVYEGLGEASMLLTYGVSFACLWHLYDPEIASEVVNRYRELTQNLVSHSPINYQSWLLPEIPPPKNTHLTETEDLRKKIEDLTEDLRRMLFTASLAQNLRSNPLLQRWDTKIMRSIIKKGFRIVYK